MNHFLPYADRPAPKPRGMTRRTGIIILAIVWGVAWCIATAATLSLANHVWHAAGVRQLATLTSGE